MPDWNPPGRLNVLLTLLGLVLVVSFWRGWSPLDGLAGVLVGVVGGVVVVGGVSTWGYKTLRHLWQHRRWSWAIIPVPIACAAAALAMTIGVTTFDDVRPDFERVASQLLQTPGYTEVRDLTIGSMKVTHAFDRNGDVYFIVDDFYMTRSGWVYSPDGAPAPLEGEFTIEPVGHNWYKFKHVLT